jgi:hypothetical protein
MFRNARRPGGAGAPVYRLFCTWWFEEKQAALNCFLWWTGSRRKKKQSRSFLAAACPFLMRFFLNLAAVFVTCAILVFALSFTVSILVAVFFVVGGLFLAVAFILILSALA